jgi:hypothetical protein
MFYGDFENVRRLHSELWQQRNWLLQHDSALPHTSFFQQGVFFLLKTTA